MRDSSRSESIREENSREAISKKMNEVKRNEYYAQTDGKGNARDASLYRQHSEIRTMKKNVELYNCNPSTNTSYLY